jgi:hypothetical protein
MRIKITPKLKFILLVVIAVCLIGLVLFLYIFNKGTINFEGETPYTVYIENVRTIACEAAPCSITLAAGKYQITAEKTSRYSIEKEVEIPINGQTTVQLNFENKPELQIVTDWNPNNLFTLNPALQKSLLNFPLTFKSSDWQTLGNLTAKYPEIKKLALNPDKTLLIIDDGKKVYQHRFEIDSKAEPLPIQSGDSFVFGNDNQLYLLSNARFSKNQPLLKFDPTDQLIIDQSATSELGEALSNQKLTTKITSFLRTIKKATIFLSPNLKKIMILDLTNQNPELYLIDSEANTREKIKQPDLPVQNFKWIDNQQFLLETIDPSTARPQLWLGANTSDQPQLLELKSSLQNLYPQDSNQFLAITTQAQASGSLAKLVNFNRQTKEQKELFIFPQDLLPEKIEYDSAQKQMLILINRKVYSLNLQI